MQTNTCKFRKAINLVYGQGGLKLQINIPPQHILAKSKGELIIEGSVSSSEYGTNLEGKCYEHDMVVLGDSGENGIRDSGATALADALRVNQSLTALE